MIIIIVKKVISGEFWSCQIIYIHTLLNIDQIWATQDKYKKTIRKLNLLNQHQRSLHQVTLHL